MKGKCGDDLLERKLIPPWSVGCRRLTPGYNYLEVRTLYSTSCSSMRADSDPRVCNETMLKLFVVKLLSSLSMVASVMMAPNM